jgi:hypothetical protein
MLMELEIVERPRTWILWLSRIGLGFSILMLIDPLLVVAGVKQGIVDEAMLGIVGMLFISCGLGSAYKRIAFVDRRQRTLTTKYSLVFDFSEKVYSFDELSAVFVKKELAGTQGADITRQANTSYKTTLYLVTVDLKGFGKGRKRIQLKKCFVQQEAEDLAAKVATLIK